MKTRSQIFYLSPVVLWYQSATETANFYVCTYFSTNDKYSGVAKLYCHCLTDKQKVVVSIEPLYDRTTVQRKENRQPRLESRNRSTSLKYEVKKVVRRIKNDESKELKSSAFLCFARTAWISKLERRQAYMYRSRHLAIAYV